MECRVGHANTVDRSRTCSVPDPPFDPFQCRMVNTGKGLRMRDHPSKENS